MICWCYIRDAGDVLLADHDKAEDVQRLFGRGRWEQTEVVFDKEDSAFEELRFGQGFEWN